MRSLPVYPRDYDPSHLTSFSLVEFDLILQNPVGEDEKWIYRPDQQIHTYHNSSISSKSKADRLRLEGAQFSREFKRCFGQSPAEMMRKVRAA
jgi:hypothetical protein